MILLKFIIILIAIMYLFPKVLRWGLKMFIGSQISKAQSEFRTQQKPKSKEGEIKVDYNQSTKKGENLRGGEYVDYEEVKD